MSKLDWEKASEICVNLHSGTCTYLNSLIQIIHESLRSIYYFRTIKSPSEDSIHSSENAIITIENVLYQHSAITWCKLFGSKKEDTHYIKIFNKEPMKNSFKTFFDELQISNEIDFIQYFLEGINMTTDSFEEYVRNMKIFRDEIIVHTDLSIYHIPKNKHDEKRQKRDRLEKHPDLEPAKISLYWLYKLITKLLNKLQTANGYYRFRIHSNQRIDELTLKECEELRISLSLSSGVSP